MHETTASAITRFDFSTDPDLNVRARIGLLVLASDQTLERELRQLTDAVGVDLYHARLPNETVVNPDTLAKTEAELPIAASLLPKYLGLSAIGYGCTSGATIIGEDRVEAILKQSHPDIPSSNPLTAAKAALKLLGVQRLGLLTPYTPEVTESMQLRFGEAGIAITVVGSFYEESDIVVGQIDPQSILKAAIALGKSDLCDGIFISCTSLRAAGIIEEAEFELGKPVIASNHALAWHLLRLAGIDNKLAGFGRLFSV